MYAILLSMPFNLDFYHKQSLIASDQPCRKSYLLEITQYMASYHTMTEVRFKKSSVSSQSHIEMRGV